MKYIILFFAVLGFMGNVLRAELKVMWPESVEQLSLLDKNFINRGFVVRAGQEAIVPLGLEVKSGLYVGFYFKVSKEPNDGILETWYGSADPSATPSQIQVKLKKTDKGTKVLIYILRHDASDFFYQPNGRNASLPVYVYDVQPNTWIYLGLGFRVRNGIKELVVWDKDYSAAPIFVGQIAPARVDETVYLSTIGVGTAAIMYSPFYIDNEGWVQIGPKLGILSRAVIEALNNEK